MDWDATMRQNQVPIVEEEEKIDTTHWHPQMLARLGATLTLERQMVNEFGFMICNEICRACTHASVEKGVPMQAVIPMPVSFFLGAGKMWFEQIGVDVSEWPDQGTVHV